ncbi:MAG: cytochrome c [Acetobacteraceae bacterium]
MTVLTRCAVATVLLLSTGGLLAAAPATYTLPAETATLRPGPGVETAQKNCVACHSADYLAMQPPGKGKAFWDAEVVKMRQVYKAVIDDSDAKAIADYLAKAY